MASMKKVKERNGVGVYRVRWRVDGEPMEQWVHGHEAALALKIQLEADAAAGQAYNPRRGAVVLNDYFDEWIASRLVKGRPLAATTQAGYRGVWRRNVESNLGRKELRAVRVRDVRKWHSRLAADTSTDQAAKSYRLLHAVFATAEADELVRLNPCRLRGASHETHAERPMVQTSLVLALAEAIEPRFRALVLLAAFGGLRTGETLGLRRRDVDLEAGVIHVVQQAQEIGGYHVAPPKSEAGRRSVALPTIVVDALREHMALHSGHDDQDGAVFTTPTGHPLRRATVSDAWRAAVSAADAPDGLRLHDLRHHAATLAARAPGITTKELMARIGHSSPRAALIYQHATVDRDRKIASYLDDVVASAKPTSAPPVLEVLPGSRGAVAGELDVADDVPDTEQAV